jgi:DEAD/DEAH box helicase
MSALSDLLLKCYEHDLIERSKLFGIENPTLTFPQKMVVKVISECDELSNNKKISESEKRLIITSLGILWDCCNKKFPGIKTPIMIILSRLGYLPNTALFVNDNFNLSRIDSFAIQSNRLLNSHKTENDGRVYFTSLQQKVWEKINSSPRIAISAPTSAGKTFVITKWISENLVAHGGICLFVAPTLSLCSEIAQVFYDSANGKYDVSTNLGSKIFDNCAYILTQEKVIANPEIIKKADYFVIDEIHNIEKFGNDDPERPLILLDVIEEIVQSASAKKIIVAGPMISGIKELSEFLFEKEFVVVEDTTSPVVSITYSFKNEDGLQLQSHLKNDQKINLKISEESVKGVGSSKFSKNARAFMEKILETIPESDGVIIFSGSTSQAANIAESISGTPNYINDLGEYCSETVSPYYNLTRCLKKGVAYHHSRIPTHIRRCIEIAFASGIIKRVIATTTLLQGVNFPAKHVIIRNPKLGTKDSAPRLSEYDLSNLRGRAGRLFKDFVGRSYLLNEDEFQEDGEMDLFPKKEVKRSLQDRYNENKMEILDDIFDLSSDKYTDVSLSALIASKITLYGNAGVESLKKLGINLTKSQIAKIILSVEKLGIEKEFYRKFKRIDPASLSKIVSLCNSNVVVPDITKPKFYEQMVFFLTEAQRKVPGFFQRKLKISTEEIPSFTVLANKWGQGIEISQIINDSVAYYRNDIGELISRIQSQVVYDLTSFLSPFMYLQNNKNITVESLESGSWNSKDLELIRQGVPREIAVRIRLKKATKYWDKILIEKSH